MKRMKFLSKFILGLLMFVTVFTFFGCGKKAVESETKAIKIALILPSTIDDMAWSQAMYEGAKAVQEKLGEDSVELKFSERLGNPIEAGVALREYASENYDIIIAHGAQYESVISEVAADFPEVSFAYGGYGVKADNVFGYDVDAHEGSFLLGMLAGLKTKTNIIGIVGPVAAGESIKYNSGFIQGVKYVNPEADVRIAYTGSFGDTVAAGEIARTHINAGADILTGTSQQAVGAIKVVSQYDGIYWFGNNIDQSVLAPKSILASELYIFEGLISQFVEKRSAGIKGGEGFHLTLENEMLELTYNDDLKDIFTAEELEKIDVAMDEIKSGSRKVEAILE
jgi:basic membrane protein A